MTAEPTGPGEEDEEQTVVTTWQNPTTAESARRLAELQALPGYQFKLDIEALGRSGHVMYRNAEELSRHATEFLTGRRGFSQDATDEFENELVRYLHNYLTSVYSLIESQRVVMRHCWGKRSDFEVGEYTEHRKASFETGEAEFMTELRNYCTHRSIPLPGISTTFSGGVGRPNLIINRLTLDRGKLLDWDGWTAPAKEYLRAQDEKFDLGPVIESYVKTASAFFNWFVERITELYADSKNEYQTAAEEYVMWYEEAMGMNTEGYRRLFGPPPSERGAGNRAERRGQRQQPKRTSKRKSR